MSAPPAWYGEITATDSPTDIAAALAGQVRTYLRGYQRLLKHRPTNVQRALMATAAVAAARYDAGVRDLA